MQTYLPKKRRALPAAGVTREQIRSRLALASGDERQRNLDPVFRVSEDFQQTFERMGRQRGAELRASAQAREQPGQERAGAAPERDRERPPRTRTERDPELSVRKRAEADPEHSREGRQGAAPGTGPVLEKFSETAFRKGRLYASVMEGTGKMMLVSCLKRSMTPERQAKNLFDNGAALRNVPGHDPDQTLVRRGAAKSAVGLVVDTLRSARRVVQSMEAMAAGRASGARSEEGSTLLAMYPFLDDSREREMLADYALRLEQSHDGREKAVLQNALVHTRSLLDKKSQMKEEFINKLRLISDRAAETLAELEAPGALEEITAAVLEPEEEALPPAPPEDGGSGEDASGAMPETELPPEVDDGADTAADGFEAQDGPAGAPAADAGARQA